MNETINAILSRRSVRSYKDEQIKPEELDLILKAGLYAPSGHNMQAWHFTVVQNKGLIDDLSAATKHQMSLMEGEFFQSKSSDENYHVFYNCPTIIVISGENAAMTARADCAAATENMLIAAESLNIGTCWIGLVGLVFRSEEVDKYAKRLELPEGYEPYYAITVGYKTMPNNEPAPRREDTVNYVK
jgi:nitroreductase